MYSLNIGSAFYSSIPDLATVSRIYVQFVEDERKKPEHKGYYMPPIGLVCETDLQVTATGRIWEGHPSDGVCVYAP